MSIKIKFFKGGSCTHPEAIVIRDGQWKSALFPSVFALILHPSGGAILYDTGYSQRFFQETRRFPLRLYALTTPVSVPPEESALTQLQEQGISPTAVKSIIISHFHADHIGGLRDFSDARFVCLKSAYAAVKNKQGFGALKAGFLAGLLPSNFEERAVFVENKPQVALPPQYAPFESGFDLFGDGSLLAVELPGHATGQLGLFLTHENQQSYFLIADACWMSRAYQELVMPHAIANLIFANSQDYQTTLKKIHQLHKHNAELKIIPTHCQETWAMLQSSQ
ncbi:MBL fold metallo-hydrolase [Oscillatoria acuminata]|uniref:Metal-dependent hydrolase, beta-lactamase superfamily II n=1 Tax=Oscillatoria acuminata PCC 6304 TaxID=56110 RepID=K9TS97_9CYAN|nr:MBL fold metallo-hydrolase [Oscillatoria acuminata]AFY84864.1 metal-dependent hydrolase, beta-lactamase superfamily II [Oscillatoria acuminata PCC 6304]